MWCMCAAPPHPAPPRSGMEPHYTTVYTPPQSVLFSFQRNMGRGGGREARRADRERVREGGGGSRGHPHLPCINDAFVTCRVAVCSTVLIGRTVMSSAARPPERG